MICVNGGVFSGMGILNRGTHGWCVRFLFCWQAAHPFMYCLIHGWAFGHKYLHYIFLVVSSHPKCPPPLWSCHTRTTSFLISSIGGITSLPESVCLQMGPSTCLFLMMGRCFAQLSMILLTVRWARMIWCSRDLSELVLNMFRNSLGGNSAISRESSTISAPGGLDKVLAGVLTFPTMWVILKL